MIFMVGLLILLSVSVLLSVVIKRLLRSCCCLVRCCLWVSVRILLWYCLCVLLGMLVLGWLSLLRLICCRVRSLLLRRRIYVPRRSTWLLKWLWGLILRSGRLGLYVVRRRCLCRVRLFGGAMLLRPVLTLRTWYMDTHLTLVFRSALRP